MHGGRGMTPQVKVLGWVRYVGRQGTMFRNEVKALGGGSIDGVTLTRENWIAVADEKAAQVFRHLAATWNWVPDRTDRTIPDPPETKCPPEWQWMPNDGKQPKTMPVTPVVVSKEYKEVGPPPKVGTNKGAPAGTYGKVEFEVVV